MKLLIDEMYPAVIAEQLRDRDHDATGVVERTELRALPDSAIFDTAQQEHRALVTENVADFVTLANAADQRSRPHRGLVLVDPAKFPRGRTRTIGRMVTQLDALLRAHPGEEPSGVRHWL